MKSVLSNKELIIDSIIQKEWCNRIYTYKDEQFRKDCTLFVKHFCKKAKLQKPVIIYLDSPAGCLFASALIENLKINNLNTLIKDCYSDKSLKKIWGRTFSDNQLISISDISELEKDSIIKATLNSIEGINLKTVKNNTDQSYGYNFQNLFRSRNIEKIKKKISIHVWENHYPHGIPIKSDFMISSLNIFPNYNGIDRPYNYEEFIFFDLMSRLEVIRDKLFNDLRQILLNGAFDFYWYGQICLISKLPQTLKRVKSGSAKINIIQFSDGYTYKTK
jgi:hypothetical protein